MSYLFGMVAIHFKASPFPQVVHVVPSPTSSSHAISVAAIAPT